MSDVPPVVRARGLDRSYVTGAETVRALRGADLDVAAGEMVAVMGPSGSGKSTMLHTLGLMDRPDGGSYLLGGVETLDLGRSARARLRATAIGFVFQAFHLVEHRRAVDNVALPLTYLRVPRREARARAAAALEWVGLTHRASALPPSLSGGEKQRVAIARAVVHRPRLLLCDEPTGSLDQVNGSRVLELLARACADGIAVVMVTHDPTVAAHANRCVRIVDGALTDDTRTRA